MCAIASKGSALKLPAVRMAWPTRQRTCSPLSLSSSTGMARSAARSLAVPSACTMPSTACTGPEARLPYVWEAATVRETIIARTRGCAAAACTWRLQPYVDCLLGVEEVVHHGVLLLGAEVPPDPAEEAPAKAGDGRAFRRRHRRHWPAPREGAAQWAAECIVRRVDQHAHVSREGLGPGRRDDAARDAADTAQRHLSSDATVCHEGALSESRPSEF